MSLTLAAAAHLAGIDKSTLRRAVKAGKISAVRDDNGVWRVEACEVERLYPLTTPEEARPDAPPAALPRQAPPESAGSTTDALVAELRAALADMRQQRDRWEAQADSWKAQAERLTTALPKPVAEPSVIEMQGAVPPEAATPVTRPAQTRRQKLVKFWFGKQYRRRAG